MDKDIRLRPFAYEDGRFYWNMQRVPRTLNDGKTPHPGRTSAIFVVHGIGQQVATETAATLRSGFEDAMEGIREWQERENKSIGGRARLFLQNLVTSREELEKRLKQKEQLPSPFVYEGYWADYWDVEKTFPEDCSKFCEREKNFFGRLWKERTLSGIRTGLWYLKQQVRLLSPRVFVQNPVGWFLYLPLQVLFPVTLVIGLVRYPKIVSGYLADVRMYVDPRGEVERAITQRIDKRVGTAFLRMIGLDWDFRTLLPDDRIDAGGERIMFERVVWVAHSLGTVISYNVLSSLFARAGELANSKDPAQQEGVKRFRESLSRFITLGSPLNKAAFLFGEKCLIPWPDTPRRGLICSGEDVGDGSGAQDTEWWINFYHIFDPVSAPLHNEKYYGAKPPLNFHVWSLGSWIPAYSHITYWSARGVLELILGRTYGQKYLPHRRYRQWLPPAVLNLIGILVWALIMYFLAKFTIHSVHAYVDKLIHQVRQAM